MIPNATTPPRHQLKISIPTRHTAGPLLLAAEAGAIRLGQLAGRALVARKLLLARLPLRTALKEAVKEAVKEAARGVDKVVDKVVAKVAVKVAVKVVVKAAARVAVRVAVKVEGQPLQLPPSQLPHRLALPVPTTNPSKMTATTTTTKCDLGNYSSPRVPIPRCGQLRKTVLARG